jgi:hypothetical protein
MEWWNLGILGYFNSPLEGRALSRPATTKRGPPEPIFPAIPPFPPVRRSLGKGGYSNIPVEVIDKSFVGAMK